MYLPQPITEIQQQKYNDYLDLKARAKWARLDYVAMFPKPTSQSDYETRIDHDMELIGECPPMPNETQGAYYKRVKPILSKRLFGITMSDMGYVRRSKRVENKIIKVWVLL